MSVERPEPPSRKLLRLLTKLIYTAGTSAFAGFFVFVGWKISKGEDFSHSGGGIVRLGARIANAAADVVGYPIVGSAVMVVSLAIGIYTAIYVWRWTN